MADTKISQELPASPLTGTELTEVVQAGNNRKTTTQDIANLALPLGTTGSGAAVLEVSPTIASPTFTGTIVGSGTVPNSALQHSSITIAGHSVSLGASQNLAASDLVNGTTGSGDIVLATAPTLSNVDISGGSITGMPTPVNPEDVANKDYVDSVASGLSVHTAVAAATTTTLPNSPTYSNGSSGVGATLTASTNGALTVDGYAVQTNDRLLVKNQSSGANNGVYVVTNPGASGAAYVLTRATDFDDSENITPNSYFFVESGSTNAATGWLMTTAEPITIGTTVLTFTQFSGSSAYLAGMGLTLTGNVFALTDSSITIAGHTVSLGGSQNLAASDLTNGTTGEANIVLADSPTLTGTVNVTGIANITPGPVSLTGPSGGVGHHIVISSSGTVPTGDGQMFDSTNPLALPWQGPGVDGSPGMTAAAGIAVAANYVGGNDQLTAALMGIEYIQGTTGAGGGAGVCSNIVSLGSDVTSSWGLNVECTNVNTNSGSAMIGCEININTNGAGSNHDTMILEFAGDGTGQAGTYLTMRDLGLLSVGPNTGNEASFGINFACSPYPALNDAGSLMLITGNTLGTSYGIDLRNAIFANYAFASRNFTMDGDGNGVAQSFTTASDADLKTDWRDLGDDEVRARIDGVYVGEQYSSGVGRLFWIVGIEEAWLFGGAR